jgi:8-amino-7-oxononanoate synthase
VTKSGSLEEYAARRFRIVAGKLGAGLTTEQCIREMKTVYFGAVDAMKSEAKAAGRPFINFANYDYLGLGLDERIRNAAAAAAKEHGTGVEASRLVGGNRTIHDTMESELAAFLGVEDAMSLVSGYMTNASLLGHLLMKGDLIFADDLAHNSIVVGTDTSHATTLRFAHGDLDDLERLLAENRSRAKRALIVVEGLYSMDGDLADLPRLIEIRNRYNAWLMVDEAHSIGVLGPSGRGLAEHFGVDAGQIDFIVGTLSKTFAASGGFIAGRKIVIDWLRFTLPAFVYSVGLSPMIAAAVRKGLSIIDAEKWRVERLRENSRFFLAGARRRGLDTGAAVGAGIVTIQFPNPDACISAARKLLEAGCYAPPIAQIGVPKDKPRIRFFVTAEHTQDEITYTLDQLAEDKPVHVSSEAALHIGA